MWLVRNLVNAAAVVTSPLWAPVVTVMAWRAGVLFDDDQKHAKFFNTNLRRMLCVVTSPLWFGVMLILSADDELRRGGRFFWEMPKLR